MTARELIEILKNVDPDMKVMIEGRDSTGEYCDADEMTKKHIYIIKDNCCGIVMKERTMYVIRRADGKFYWKHQNISSYYGYDDFDKAHLFSTEKGAKSRIGYGSDGQECEIKQVKIVLVD